MTGKVRSAADVKLRYERKWLEIEGITAIGLGLINNEQCIIISVEENIDEVRALIPGKVEGIPVEIRISGKLMAN
jgi:hypothetical protein